MPYSSLESVIEDCKDAYYLALRRTQTTIRTPEPEWEPWLCFFLEALHEQKRRLEEKIERERVLAGHLPSLSVEILDLARAHGGLAVAGVVRARGANRNMVKDHLESLVAESHLVLHGAGCRAWYGLAVRARVIRERRGAGFRVWHGDGKKGEGETAKGEVRTRWNRWDKGRGARDDSAIPGLMGLMRPMGWPGAATLCRLENSVDWRSIWRISKWFVQSYAKRLRKSGRRRIVLDLDSTDDPTHGQQEFSFYHGYFRRHIYHPLLVFDAETGDLIAAVLRPGNQAAAARAVSVLRRIVKILRRWVGERLEIEIRGDCGFATPELYEYCESEGLDYTIGFSRNPRLEAAVEELVEKARKDFETEGVKQRQFTEFFYQADSWSRERRMVAKVEVHEPGLNRRFVVTNRTDLEAEALYDHYTERGQMENYIKALKNALAADRLSCHRFVANQFRLLLHALAYQLLLALRRYLEGTPWHKLEIETLRRRIFKLGARIRETTRRIWIHCSSSYPEQETFFLVLRRICGPPG